MPDLNQAQLEKKLYSLLKPNIRKAKSVSELVAEIGVDQLSRFSKREDKVDELVKKKQAEQRVRRTLKLLLERQEDDLINGHQPDQKLVFISGKQKLYYLEKKADYSELLRNLYGLDRSLATSLAMRLPADEQQNIQNIEERKLPSALVDWRQKIFIGRSGVCYRARIDPKTINSIYSAVENEKFVAFDYVNSKGENERIEVFPWGVMLRGESCYLIANKFDSKKMRPVPYAMHRITSPELTDRLAFNHPSMPRNPEDFQRFCQESQIDVFANEKDQDIRIQLRFLGNQGRSLKHTVLSEDQIIEELPDSQLRLTATVRNSMELHRFIMGYGDDIEVEAPAELRALIAQKMKNAYARYEIT